MCDHLCVAKPHRSLVSELKLMLSTAQTLGARLSSHESREGALGPRLSGIPSSSGAQELFARQSGDSSAPMQRQSGTPPSGAGPQRSVSGNLDRSSDRPLVRLSSSEVMQSCKSAPRSQLHAVPPACCDPLAGCSVHGSTHDPFHPLLSDITPGGARKCWG